MFSERDLEVITPRGKVVTDFLSLDGIEFVAGAAAWAQLPANAWPYYARECDDAEVTGGQHKLFMLGHEGDLGWWTVFMPHDDKDVDFVPGLEFSYVLRDSTLYGVEEVTQVVFDLIVKPLEPKRFGWVDMYGVSDRPVKGSPVFSHLAMSLGLATEVTVQLPEVYVLMPDLVPPWLGLSATLMWEPDDYWDADPNVDPIFVPRSKVPEVIAGFVRSVCEYTGTAPSEIAFLL